MGGGKEKRVRREILTFELSNPHEIRIAEEFPAYLRQES